MAGKIKRSYPKKKDSESEDTCLKTGKVWPSRDVIRNTIVQHMSYTCWRRKTRNERNKPTGGEMSLERRGCGWLLKSGGTKIVHLVT